MKYHNKKVTVDGITFDSKREANRYRELSLLEKAGAIQNLQMQVEFELIPAIYEMVEQYSDKTGKRLKDKKVLLEKKCSYIADFVYTENGQMVVEDTKGMRTRDYIIKRKLMLFMKGIQIKEV